MMKKLLILLFVLSPLLMWGQSKTYLDSVNYYFGILLTHERDSINDYNEIWNPDYKRLNRAIEETDTTKFINPWKHIDYCIEHSHQNKQFYPHSTTNKENMMFLWGVSDYTDYWWGNPEVIAHRLFHGWKDSPGHYKFMIQDTDGKAVFFRPADDYKTYKVLMKISYKECTIEEINQGKKCPFVMVASFTAWN